MAAKKSTTKSPAKKAPAKSSAKTPAKTPVKGTAKSSAKKAPAKKAPAKKAPVKKAPVKKAPAKKAPAKKAPVKKAPAKKAPVKKAPVKKAPAKKAPAKKAPAKKAPAKKAPVAAVPKKPEPPKRPAIVKGPSQDGITSTKEFDLKFLFVQKAALLEERAKLVGQATRLEDEANALIADAEMGDVQFDDEGGEGDTMVVERERDQILSAQALQTVEEIDKALQRMKKGEYGYSIVSGLPIPKERLKALPWATELVTERAGVLGRH